MAAGFDGSHVVGSANSQVPQVSQLLNKVASIFLLQQKYGLSSFFPGTSCDVMAKAAEQSQLPEFLPGNCEWKALRKMLTRQRRR